VQADDAFFTWGLPFFFGRNIYTSIYGVNTGGAYWAYNAAAGTNAVVSVAPPAANVAKVTVDGGLNQLAYSNAGFITITLCAPGSTTNCQVIDHVLVDTGSSGLRIPSTLLSSPTSAYYNPTLLAALPNVNPSAPVAECVVFASDTYYWGSVRSADVKMGGPSNNSEVATAVPIHIMGDITSVPSSCSTITDYITGNTQQGTQQSTVSDIGANGLLGVGTLQYDCDMPGYASGSTNYCTNASTLPPGTYYGGCSN
jgi:hypothetical protein